MATWPFLQADTDLVTNVALYSMFPFIIAFSFIIFIFYRYSRENKLKQERLSLELTALRAQMNPHFIFNCLNGILNEIQANRNESASHYLLKFTTLTRRVLENSGNKWITLGEDIEMLKAYAELEQLRLNGRFTFDIHCCSDIDPQETEVPMLLIQPLIENIIWHGFKGEGKHMINVNITLKGKQLIYEIRNNGKVIAKESEPTNQVTYKKKSLGKKLVLDQLKAIEQITKTKTGMKEYRDEERGEYIVEVILPYVG